jgi:ankyrin repeat protein
MMDYFHEDFFRAIQEGDLEALERWLEEDASLLEANDSDGTSAIMAAIYAEQPEVLRFFRDRGRNLDIFEACAAGDLERVRELVSAQPELIEAVSDDGFTPLALAARFGRREVVAFLLDQGASPQSETHDPLHLSPLHTAVAAGEIEIARLLLEHGAAVNEAQAEGLTPLHVAAQNGDLAMVELLLAYGADPLARDSEGQTPIELAKAAGHHPVVVRLSAALPGKV